MLGQIDIHHYITCLFAFHAVINSTLLAYWSSRVSSSCTPCPIRDLETSSHDTDHMKKATHPEKLDYKKKCDLQPVVISAYLCSLVQVKRPCHCSECVKRNQRARFGFKKTRAVYCMCKHVCMFARICAENLQSGFGLRCNLRTSTIQIYYIGQGHPLGMY